MQIRKYIFQPPEVLIETFQQNIAPKSVIYEIIYHIEEMQLLNLPLYFDIVSEIVQVATTPSKWEFMKKIFLIE